MFGITHRTELFASLDSPLKRIVLTQTHQTHIQSSVLVPPLKTVDSLHSSNSLRTRSRRVSLFSVSRFLFIHLLSHVLFLSIRFASIQLTPSLGIIGCEEFTFIITLHLVHNSLSLIIFSNFFLLYFAGEMEHCPVELGQFNQKSKL